VPGGSRPGLTGLPALKAKGPRRARAPETAGWEAVAAASGMLGYVGVRVYGRLWRGRLPDLGRLLPRPGM